MDIRVIGGAVAALALITALIFGLTALGPRSSTPAELPDLKRVMLSTGGVGYFEYQADVSGDAQIALPVRMDQVDDVLKSIVVFDDKGGTGFVQLPSRAPLSDIFRGLPFGPDALNSNAALIQALKGSEVSVSGPLSADGRIVSIVEETAKDENNTQIKRHRVGIMTDDGLRQFVLEDADSISFKDPVLQNQINQALVSVAEHREGQGRTLKIRANGEGRRKVTIAYVVEAPLWKSSYRLTTGVEPGKAHLQGWAILENVSGTDWNDVDLTVVTGNPVTFRQALYQTYYVSRPEVPVEVLGRILPRPDEGSVGATGLAEDASGAMMAPPPPPPPVPAAPAESVRVTGSRAARYGYRSNTPTVAQAKPLAAESKEAATQVIFHLPNKVSVLNGQSLAVPIVDQKVPGELVALYQPETHPTHPLAAVRLSNDTGFGLPPGVLTLYDVQTDDKKNATTSYVGDAQLSTFPVGESRFLAFALDQKVTIDRDDKSEKTIANATLANGVFKASVVDERTSVYTIKGAPKEDRKIVIEHPRAPGWNLVTPDPKGAEMTPDRWRIPVAIGAGQTVKFTVVTQWPRDETQQLVDIDLDTVLAYASNARLTEAQRDAFTRIGEIKREIAGLDSQIDTEGQARDRVFEDQQRIRQNIQAVPAGSALQQRYLRSMSDLEDQADAHKRKIDQLEREKAAQQRRLADYVGTLNL
ncbi:MAG: DUF4139 domain-containing protein [Alphaproteobacteria bacterium]|nr:DUF4139 domain-containing protein [Alphaproteobacteria bacterium]